MFKFLRRHSKWILAIFGTLLMVVFLVPQAIDAFAQAAARGSAVWAKADGVEIKRDAFVQATDDLELFREMGLPVGPYGILEDPAHWYLLVREADAAGLIGGRASDELGDGVRRVRRADDALARYLGVNRLLSMYVNAAKLSDHRQKEFARRHFHGVDVHLLVLEAQDRADAAMPTESEIQAQYEAYREIEPGAGDHGFGYRLADRFKIEWLRVQEPAIREMVEASGTIDGVALAEHWQENPGGRTDWPAVVRGGEIPEVVRQDLLDRTVDDARGDIEKYITARMLETRRRLRIDASGYYELPADWATIRPGFEDLALSIQEEFPGLDLPEYGAIGDRWLAVEDLREVDALAFAATATFTTAARLVQGLREFGDDATLETPTQAGVAGPVLRGFDGGIVVFRVTDVDPARAPRDVSEVRDAVVRDLRRLEDYRAITARRDAILATAQGEGLLGVALDEDVPLRRSMLVSLGNLVRFRQAVQQNLPVTPAPAVLPIIGPHVPTLEAIVDHALAGPSDVSPHLWPAEERFLAIPVEDKLAMVVVELQRANPLALDDYARMANSAQLPQLLQEVEDGDLIADLEATFGYDALAARHDFERLGRDDEPEDAAPADAATEAEGTVADAS